jgi:C4-dicarboxylate transporter DctM subunit
LALGLSALVTIALFELVPLVAIPSLIQASFSSFTLLAVPFFILAGNLLASSELTERLIDLARAIVGRVRGGLAVVSTITGVFFAGISGSGPADTAALGSTLLPAMRKDGYDRGFSAALIAANGAIGIIVPPSIALIIYGVVANVSIGRLFVAGVLPGVVIAISLAVVSVVQSRRHGWGPPTPSTDGPGGGDSAARGGGARRTEAGVGGSVQVVTEAPAGARVHAARPRGRVVTIAVALRRAIWGLLAPLIILGGIYGGIFTPTESAAVVVLYALLVGFLVYRDLKPRRLVPVLAESARTTGVVMIIIASASIFAFLLNTQGIAVSAADRLAGAIPGLVGTLLLVNLIVLLAGCFLDAISIFYILTPIVLPVVLALGVDPVHFGIIMCVNLAIGQITPPVGVNLYVAAAVGDIPVTRVIRSVGPILGAELVALGMITYLPAISLWLPNALGIR